MELNVFYLDDPPVGITINDAAQLGTGQVKIDGKMKLTRRIFIVLILFNYLYIYIINYF